MKKRNLLRLDCWLAADRPAANSPVVADRLRALLNGVDKTIASCAPADREFLTGYRDGLQVAFVEVNKTNEEK